MRVGGIVLCGGRSSRMGRAKAWLPFGDEVLLQRVVRVLGEAAGPIVVVAAPGQDLPTLPNAVEVTRDTVEGRGPLAALAAGLVALDGRADVVYLSSCDSPFLTAAFVRRVLSILAPLVDVSDGPLAAVPEGGGFRHPLAGAYRVSIRPAVDGLLAAGQYRLTTLLDTVATRLIGTHELADVDPTGSALRNLNTPAEYAAALRDLAGPSSEPGELVRR